MNALQSYSSDDESGGEVPEKKVRRERRIKGGKEGKKEIKIVDGRFSSIVQTTIVKINGLSRLFFSSSSPSSYSWRCSGFRRVLFLLKVLSRE